MTKFDPGKRLIDGDELNAAFGAPQWTVHDGIIAKGASLSDATPLLSLGVNVVTTVTSSNKGVALPFLDSGVIYMHNADSADAVTVFARGGGAINGVAGATGVEFAAGRRVLFIAIGGGQWLANVMAAS